MSQCLDFDPRVVVTDPGSCESCPFSPPADFIGGSADYRLLMVRRFRVPSTRRVIMEHARSLEEGGITVTGRYAVAAVEILSRICAAETTMRRAS